MQVWLGLVFVLGMDEKLEPGLTVMRAERMARAQARSATLTAASFVPGSGMTIEPVRDVRRKTETKAPGSLPEGC